ncbi:N-acetyltransferase [Neofusicoccum parvum]|nr:N-acetyltransferase [Neofusicoccum parvum]
MKVNEHTAVLAPRVLLVPYSAHHVPTYHEWMQDPAIQEATASEPLTLDEEYAMQRSWRSDADKLTFIACVAPPEPQPPARIRARVHDAADAMIGDVNLFLVPDDEDDEDCEQEGGSGGHRPPNTNVVGELEIMVARPAHQNRGLGAAVLAAFLAYVRRHLDAILVEYAAGEGGREKVALKHLRVKIGAANGRSLRLFEKVGFVRTSETPNFFGELELRRDKGRVTKRIE